MVFGDDVVDVFDVSPEIPSLSMDGIVEVCEVGAYLVRAMVGPAVFGAMVGPDLWSEDWTVGVAVGSTVVVVEESL